MTEEKTCIWEQVQMGEWALWRSTCGVSKYVPKDSNEWPKKVCPSCGGTVILEPKS